MSRLVFCVKLQKEAEGHSSPPFPGELGRRIYETVSKEAWDAWIRQQTMLINEYRLSMSDAHARRILVEQMEKFLFGTDD